MIVIFEGADLTGKTTIADRLGGLMQFPTIRPWIYLAQPKPSITSVAKTLHQLFQHISPDIIYDRFFFSEYVYAIVLGREREYVADLIREWNSVPDVSLVHLTASNEVLQQRYKERGDWYVTLAQILAARDAYSELIKIIPNNIPILELDTSRILPDDAARKVASWLKNREK